MRIIAIHILIVLTGCQTVPSKQGTTVDKVAESINAGIENNAKLDYSKPPTSVTSVLQASSAPKHKIINDYQMPENKFNVIADEVPAKQFFIGLVDDTKVNLVVHPDVTGNISLKLKDVTIEQTLSMVRHIYSYGYEATSEGIRIYPESLQTRTFKVNYLDMIRDGSSNTHVSSSGLNSDSGSSDESSASKNSGSSTLNSQINTSSSKNLWEELRQTLITIIGDADGRKVAVSPMAGLVIVQALPGELDRVDLFLQQLEHNLNRQVIIETKILEVQLNDNYRAGINWAIINNNLQMSQLGGGLHNATITGSLPSSAYTGDGSLSAIDLGSSSISKASPTIPTSVNPFGGIFSLGVNFGRLASLVELLSSQGNVQVLSSPRISTTNNQKALIKVGNDEFFVTDVSTTTSTVNGNSVTTPSIELDPFFSGIALDVTPQIDEDDFITLHIHPTISTVFTDEKIITIGDSAQRLPLAKSTIRESDSIVRAKSGELVVIGGLMQDTTAEVNSDVPWVSDIPFVGNAFRQSKQESKKSELVILLRPLVVDLESNKKLLENSLDRIDKLNPGFHFGANPSLYGTLGEYRK